jgi:hypothetical protein
VGNPCVWSCDSSPLTRSAARRQATTQLQCRGQLHHSPHEQRRNQFASTGRRAAFCPVTVFLRARWSGGNQITDVSRSATTLGQWSQTKEASSTEAALGHADSKLPVLPDPDTDSPNTSANRVAPNLRPGLFNQGRICWLRFASQQYTLHC